MIESWEWRERGIELELRRTAIASQVAVSSDPGEMLAPSDNQQAATILRAFELPWEGYGAPDQPAIFAALASENSDWRGATLYSVGSAGLKAIGPSGRVQTVMGILFSDMEAAPSMILDRDSIIDVQLVSEDMSFDSASISEIANGANRLLIGNEIVQFVRAEQIAANLWRLSGVLRGRGGSEHAALNTHPAGTTVTLIADTLVPIDRSSLGSSGNLDIAAIGKGDAEPVISAVANHGIGAKPLVPVDPRVEFLATGEIRLCWTRRSRGAWNWPDLIGTPLNEEVERYIIGSGGNGSLPKWETSVPEIILSLADIAEVSGQNVWVRQVGRYAHSESLHLFEFPQN